VLRAGSCGTRLAIASGDYKVKDPVILGHEIFGTVWKALERNRTSWEGGT